jgi:1-acyl-sn-glycerol-3-phosphate acyltransferase
MMRRYFTHIDLHGTEGIPINCPLLIISNHPNAFLDPLIVAGSMKQPVYFLARGDAMSSPWAEKILRYVHVIPIYRLSEGKQNLPKNYDTFDQCHHVLSKNGIIIIFGEGLSENNWDLRPLKKGGSRIMQQAWTSNDVKNLQVLPVGITYEHFDGGGKAVSIRFGKAFGKEIFEDIDNPNFSQRVNEKLYNDLLNLVYYNPTLQQNTKAHARFKAIWHKAIGEDNDLLESLKTEKIGQKRMKISKHKIYRPIYNPIARFVLKKCSTDPVFYDSVLFVTLILVFIIGLIFMFSFGLYLIVKFV